MREEAKGVGPARRVGSQRPAPLRPRGGDRPRRPACAQASRPSAAPAPCHLRRVSAAPALLRSCQPVRSAWLCGASSPPPHRYVRAYSLACASLPAWREHPRCPSRHMFTRGPLAGPHPAARGSTVRAKRHVVGQVGRATPCLIEGAAWRARLTVRELCGNCSSPMQTRGHSRPRREELSPCLHTLGSLCSH